MGLIISLQSGLNKAWCIALLFQELPCQWVMLLGAPVHLFWVPSLPEGSILSLVYMHRQDIFSTCQSSPQDLYIVSDTGLQKPLRKKTALPQTLGYTDSSITSGTVVPLHATWLPVLQSVPGARSQEFALWCIWWFKQARLWKWDISAWAELSLIQGGSLGDIQPGYFYGHSFPNPAPIILSISRLSNHSTSPERV